MSAFPDTFVAGDPLRATIERTVPGRSPVSNYRVPGPIGNAVDMTGTHHQGRPNVVVWCMRAAVVACGVVAPLCGATLDEWSSGARLATIIALWVAWAVCLLCVLVPSSISLTAVRLSSPTSIVCTAFVVANDGDVAALVALVLTVVTTLLVFSADVGDSFVQLSAYGDERRHLLRCPPAMIVIQVLAWAVWMSTIVATALFAIDRRWVVAVVLGVTAIALSSLLPERFHRYSRRWFVQVPAGLVIHDHVVLAETAMFLAANVRAVDMVTLGDTDAADLTGGCRGAALRVTLADFETVVLAATRTDPGGKAIHVKSMTVCPSRPGRTLGEMTTPPPNTTSPASS